MLTKESRERLERLRDRIAVCQVIENHGESLRVGFNMATFTPSVEEDMTGHNCPTACCIAGHARIMAKEENFDEAGSIISLGVPEAWVKVIGVGYLGLEADIASRLFMPNDEDDLQWDLEEITLAQAQGAIQSVLDTDGTEVIWPDFEE